LFNKLYELQGGVCNWLRHQVTAEGNITVQTHFRFKVRVSYSPSNPVSLIFKMSSLNVRLGYILT
jgi:hypothetical protein